ncbi:hypothetical protein INN71_09595 [Nocardioides sp. ChNu-153]|uniref:hypothetical protein n=1 Tax=unclassified Nocardioides TaxID=2615069 RepID=UPI0024074201|nr:MULTISPECIES: hypothetical protein [unclassified Nocardioides]MDF9715659.1 hypothetical protein [Nocardioides sp. ChNu-99]MDN7121643.1 hypothetical protein [Nocardioides sp. ChNu-153]
MSDYTSEQFEAIQVVVDRVTSWQDGATEGTVDTELHKGFEEVGIEVSEADRAKLADAIQDEHGEVDAQSILGGTA